MPTYPDRSLTVDDVRRVLSPYITYTNGDEIRSRLCPECGESGSGSNKLVIKGSGTKFWCKCHKCDANTRTILKGLELDGSGNARYVPPPAAEFASQNNGRVQHPGKMAPPGSSPPRKPYTLADAREYLRRIAVRGGPAGEFLYVNSYGDEAEHKRWLKSNGEKLPLTYDLKGPNFYLLHIKPDAPPEPFTPPGVHEGEKDTAKSALLGFDAFGTAGGAQRAHHALINELIELAIDRETGVIPFQDNDNPGVKWAHELIPDILRQGRRVFWANPANLGEKESFSDYPDRQKAIYETARRWHIANPDDNDTKRGKGEILITDLGDVVLTWKTQPLRLPGEKRPFCKNKHEMPRKKRREETWCEAGQGWQGEVSTQGIGTCSISCGKCNRCRAHWMDEKKGYHDPELTANVRRDVWTISSGATDLTPSNIVEIRESQRQRGKKNKIQVASYIRRKIEGRETPWDPDVDGGHIDPAALVVWTLIIEDPLKAGIEAYEAYKKNTEAYCKRKKLQLKTDPFADVSDTFLESLLTADRKRLSVPSRQPITTITHWNWPRCYEERPLSQPTMSKYSRTIDTTGMELDGGMVVHLTEQQKAMLSPEEEQQKAWELQGRADKRAQLRKDKPELAAMLSTREWMDGISISLMLWAQLMQIVEDEDDAKAKGEEFDKNRKVEIPGCKIKTSFLKSAVRAFMGKERYRQAYFEIYRRIGVQVPAEITPLAEFQPYDKETLAEKFSGKVRDQQDGETKFDTAFLRKKFPITRPVTEPTPEPELEPDEPTDEGDPIATAARRSYVPDWYREDHMAATIEFHDPYTQAEADVEGARIMDEVRFAMMAGDFNEAEYWLVNEWETLWNDRVQPGVYPPRNLLGRVRSAWDAIDDNKAKQS